jgi:transmembrane sensor
MQSNHPSEFRLIYLFKGYISGSLTEIETAELNGWAERSVENRKVMEDLANEGYIEAGIRNLQAYNTEAALLRVKKEGGAEKARPYYTIFKYMSVAASLFLLCFATFYFYRNKVDAPSVSTGRKTIHTGGKHATLTLASGETIILSGVKNGLVAVQGNAVVNKTKEGQLLYVPGADLPDAIAYNTVTTPRGGEYRLTLSDGSRVWLNAASSIRYPAVFTGDKRVVEITGEVYLEVAKMKNRPFIVSSKGQQVEVLGTHFNINAYSDEPITKTTLLEGSVKVSIPQARTASDALHAGHSVLLSPNQQALRSGQELKVATADIEEVVAWKNGYFRFNNDDIHTVMRKLSRWYDFEFVFDGGLSNEGYNGTISRYKNIHQVLKMLEYSNAVHFKIEGRRVTVMR